MAVEVRALAAQALAERRIEDEAEMEKAVSSNSYNVLHKVKEMFGLDGKVVFAPRTKYYKVEGIVVELDDGVYIKIIETYNSSGSNFFHFILVVPTENGGFASGPATPTGADMPIEIESLADLGEALEKAPRLVYD
jgi:hypothetical protein